MLVEEQMVGDVVLWMGEGVWLDAVHATVGGVGVSNRKIPG